MMSNLVDSIFKARKHRKIGVSIDRVPLTTLPREVRLKIWQKLIPMDQKSIRCVCKSLHDDIDSSIGVNGILGDSIQNLHWIHNARLQSLVVHTLVDPLGKFYITNPMLLQKLTIGNGIMTVVNLRTLMQDLTNLRDLSLMNIPSVLNYFKDFDGFTEAEWTTGQVVLALTELPLFLTVVSANPKLKTLHLDFNTKNWEVVAHREMQEDELRNIDWSTVTGLSYPAHLKALTIRICDQLGYGYNMAVERNDSSFISSVLRAWSSFLITQRNLETFCSSFGVLNWKYYKPVLLNCQNTLNTIEILNVSSSVMTGSGTKQAELLDWSFFQDFVNLRCFKLLASSDYDFNFLPSINFCQFPLNQIQELELTGVELTEDDIYQALYNTRRQLHSLKLIRNFIFTMSSLYTELLRSIQHRQVKIVTLHQAKHLFEMQDLSKKELRNCCKHFGYSFHFEKEQSEGVLEIRQKDVPRSKIKGMVRIALRQHLDTIA